jgi:hypothetical protein
MKQDSFFPLASIYQSWLNQLCYPLSHSAQVCEINSPFDSVNWMPSQELTLQSRWFTGDFGSEWTTPCGKNLRILDFGEWNAGSGPDFKKASISIDHQIFKGDIEIDLSAISWEHHGHAQDPAYDQTILHLFLHPTQETFFARTSSHREVFSFQLQPPQHNSTLLYKPGWVKLGRCSTPFESMSEDEIDSILKSAAQYRLSLKAQRIQRWIQQFGKSQATYLAFAETLGYKENTQAFLILAQRLPLTHLKKLSLAEIESTFFGLTGIIETLPYDKQSPPAKEYLRQLWQTWWQQRSQYSRWLEPDQQIHFKTTATRPANHPQRRLATLAIIIQQQQTLFNQLLDPENWSLQLWNQRFKDLEHPFWNHHSTLTSKAFTAPQRLLGQQRLTEILPNVIYPMLIPERGRLQGEYYDLRTTLLNHKVVKASLRLFGNHPQRAKFTRYMYQHQALLQIYQDFCLEDYSNCLECPFPKQMLDWHKSLS